VSRIAAILFLWLCAAAPVFAQNAGDLPLVGYLRINTPDGNEPMATMYRTALAALGWVDGRNIRVEFRLAEGHPERFPELAEALVREKASVIVANGMPAIRAAQRGTMTSSPKA
jgi:putative tryptophan/tyrosine transport system substrate-binding protein